MPIRSGGRYELRDGKPVLIERTGYKPEAEIPADTPKTNAPKRAQKQENRDADA